MKIEIKQAAIKALDSIIIDQIDHIGTLEIYVQRFNDVQPIKDRIEVLKQRLEALKALKAALLADGAEAY